MKVNPDHISRRNTYYYPAGKTQKENTNEMFYSKCPKCESFGFLSVMGERVYNDGQPVASDHDDWMQCHRCGHMEAKLHSKAETMITGFIDVTEYNLGYSKAVLEPVHEQLPRFQKGSKNKPQQNRVNESSLD